MRKDEGGAHARVERRARQRARDCCGRHPWPVLRPGRDIPNRRIRTAHELPLPRRLRRPRPVQRGDNLTADMPQATVSGQGAADQREPRIEGGDPDIRLLHGVRTKIRVHACLDVLHGHVRLPHALGRHRRPDLLCARRFVPVDTFDRPNKSGGPIPRNPTRGANGRFGMVRPRRREGGLCNIAPGRRLHVRLGGSVQVPRDERHVAHSARAPAVHGRVLVAVRQPSIHCMVRAELLLPLRQLGEHPRGWPRRRDVLQRLPGRAGERARRPEPAGGAECWRQAPGILPVIYTLCFLVSCNGVSFHASGNVIDIPPVYQIPSHSAGLRGPCPEPPSLFVRHG